MDTDSSWRRYVLFRKTVKPSETDERITYDGLSDDATTTVSTNKSIKPAEISNVSEDEQMTSVRE